MLVGHGWVEADLGADALGHRGHHGRILAAQDAFQNAQFLDAIGVQRRLAEQRRRCSPDRSASSTRLGATTTQVPATRSPTRSRSC